MSTVSSIDTYCKIAGISEYLILISDSQDIEGLVSSYVPADVVNDYGSFMAIARDGEIELIWGVSTWVAWDNSHVELIWSAKAFYRQIKRQTARRNRTAKNAR